MVRVQNFESYDDYYITIQEKKCEKVGYNIKVNEDIKSLDDILMIRDYLKTKYNYNDTTLYTISTKPQSESVKYNAFLVMTDNNSKVIIIREGTFKAPLIPAPSVLTNLDEKKDQDGDSGNK
jgi:hypothetical protein